MAIRLSYWPERHFHLAFRFWNPRRTVTCSMGVEFKSTFFHVGHIADCECLNRN